MIHEYVGQLTHKFWWNISQNHVKWVENGRKTSLLFTSNLSANVKRAWFILHNTESAFYIWASSEVLCYAHNTKLCISPMFYHLHIMKFIFFTYNSANSALFNISDVNGVCQNFLKKCVIQNFSHINPWAWAYVYAIFAYLGRFSGQKCRLCHVFVTEWNI